ncbi:hypothetical protein DKM44_14420 [Deinococcus irradiatisoli]|uniref:Uncharacterized protein n=1 Tax=Deinococcus irradiatisoli TaxID=2202254 RepID=A0A2Z3JK91_9DEIO|nr:hypothetical protein DKM44_14420 [Deinococcus irradiatisoli]
MELLAAEAHPPVTLKVIPDGDQVVERRLLDGFSAALRKKNPAAQQVLDRMGIATTYYRQHLRGIGTWDIDRRRLLANGAALRLLEDHAAPAQAGLFEGLTLEGKVAEQKRQLARHLMARQRSISANRRKKAKGWLEPALSSTVRPVAEPKAIWLFSSDELAEPDMLHPLVARSLLAQYLPAAGGVVVDPMAGSGVVGREASRLGHRSWSSDIRPGADFVAVHDLERGDLSEVTGEGVADLLFLHPPLKRQLHHSPDTFEELVGTYIDNSLVCLKEGGLMVLVVSSEDAAGALQTVTQTLVDSVNPEREGRVKQHGLTAHHLAVARDGSQAWHILVSRFGMAG